MSPKTSLFSFLNRPLGPTQIKHGYSVHVDQYRGLCALLVFINHGTVHEELLVNNFKWPVFVAYFGSPYLSVLMFFCISGYVIGITNDTAELDIKQYLKKRAIRLYPIYLVSIMLCIIIAGNAPLYEIIGNIFFLQNGSTIPVFINYSTWTLNYEALYYLLFIALFYLRPKMWVLLTVMLLISIFLNNNGTFSSILSYNNCFYFWIMGLVIGWNLFKNEAAKDRFVPILSLLFLHLCYTHLGMGTMLLHIIGMRSYDSLSPLFYLPFCLMVLCILTSKENALLRANKIICYLSPIVVFLYLGVSHRIFEDIRWVMCFIYWVLSLILYFEKRMSAFALDKLMGIGRISYALYLLHVPVALLIKKTIFIADQRLEVLVKYTLWIGITFGVSILLERHVQPKIKKFFL
jgi:peptidoglycan/LPS O-acetylase OafA/YrhL